MLDGQALCFVGFDVEARIDMLIPFSRIRCSFASSSKIARGATEPFVAARILLLLPWDAHQTARLQTLASTSTPKLRSVDRSHSPICSLGATIPATPLRILLRSTMGIAQYNNNYRHLHSLKVTATILTHLATQSTPTIPGRHNSKPTQLPGIRSLFTIDTAQAVAILPPLQCAVGLINLGTDEHKSPVPSPTKPVMGSPTSPSMTPTSPICQVGTSSPSLTISPKTRRPLSLHDLLSAAPTAPSIPRCKNVHHRRQCGITDCHKYALTGGFCIRHGGGKRCNFEGCQTVAQSGGRCKAHGGGSKCKVLGCGSVARRKGFCMTHGGRQQCKVDGCTKCAHGGGFCISHGGGKRCSSRSCDKSAQAGGFCYSHGGGKRCAAPECFQAARKGGLCIRHRKAAYHV